MSVAIDKFNRVWIATDGVGAYFDMITWKQYHSFPANDVAFGPSCEECSINDEDVWTATKSHGLTHSRLPTPLFTQEVGERIACQIA